MIKKEEINDIIKKRREERNALFSTCILVKNKIIAITQVGNFPIEFDLSNRNMSYINNLEGYEPFIADQMLSDGKNIYILELNGNRLLKWNLQSKKCNYYDIDCGKKDWGNYVILAKYREKIYIFPRYIDAIIKINHETGEVERDGCLYAEVKQLSTKIEQNKYSYFDCGCLIHNFVWIFQNQNNLLIVYDLSKGIWQKFILPLKIGDCVHMVQYSGNIFFLNSEGEVYCWNIENNFVRLLINFKEDNKYNEFARVVVTDRKMYLLPSFGENIFTISFDTGVKEIYKNYPKQFKYYAPESWYKYYGYCEDENNFYFAMRTANCILCINKQNGRASWIKPNIYLDNEKLNVCRKYYNNIILEGICSLEKLLENLDGNVLNDNNGRKVSSFGEKIFRKLGEC